MPEQLTKHPDVTLQVLASAGIQCGRGASQEILKTCPAQRFCKLPGGELCVYGLPEASEMTQITAADWQTLLPQPAAPTSAAAEPALMPLGSALAIGLVLGFMGSRLWSKRR